MGTDGPLAPAAAGRRPCGGAIRRARPAATALLIFLAFGAVLLHPALFGSQVLSAAGEFVRAGPFPEVLRAQAIEDPHVAGDSFQCFVPWLRFAARSLAVDGHLPLWKDTAGTGAPLLGNGQSAMFYPTNLLAILLGAPAGVLAVQALLKLVAGAFGAWLLGRHLGLSPLASILCGLVFGFGGFQMALNLYPLTNVSLLLPLLVLAADRLALRPSPSRAAVLALVAGLQHLGGHPETAFHCQVAALALGAARIVSLRATVGSGAALRRMGWLLAALVAGGLLGAVQVLPLLEYMLQSTALARRQVMAMETGPSHRLAAAGFGVAFLVALLALRRLARSERDTGWNALLLFVATGAGLVAGLAAGLRFTFMTVLAPDWFGDTNDFGGSGSYQEQVGAFAGAALPLAVLGLLAGRPRGAAKAAGIALAAGLLAGFHAPIVSDVLEALPGFHLSLNSRLQLIALLATAVLAGLGLDALPDAARAARDRWRSVLALLAPLLAAVAALAIGVRLDLVSAGDAPARPESASLVEARPLAAALVDPLLPAPRPADGSAPTRAFCGWVKLAARPVAIRLLHGGARASVETEWCAAPPGDDPSATATGSADALGPRIYVFRAIVPERDLSPGQRLVRVWASMPDRSIAASGLMVGLGAPDGWLAFPGKPAPGGSTLGILLITLLVLGLATLTPSRGWPLALTRVALPALVAASLLPFATGSIPLVPQGLFYPPSPAIEALRGAGQDGRVLSMASSLLPPEIPTFYGIADLRCYDGIGLERVDTIIDAALGRFRRQAMDPGRTTSPGPDFALLGLLSVRYLAHLDPARSGFPRVSFAEAPGGTDATAIEQACPIFENPYFLPRARLVGGAVIEPDDGRALALLRQPAFRGDRDVVLAGGEPRAAPGASVGRAHIDTSRPDRVRVEIAPTAPAWLVLCDSWYPGWTARVDGQPREIIRANVAFRAVAVAPGEHAVEFRYEPLPHRIGAIISGLLVALLAGALLLGTRRVR